jgi:hypothetical protein
MVLTMRKDARRKRQHEKATTVTEIVAEIVGRRSPKDPPLLGPSWPKSQFDKLCDEYGGPADLGARVEKSVFQACCSEFPPGKVLPILRQFIKDEVSARRHWPWAAFAIKQYKYEINERAKYTDELSPKKICELLGQVEGAAHDLVAALATLQSLAFRLHDHSAPGRRGHLSWLNYFISQALADNVSNELTSDLVTLDFKKLDFIKRLAQVEAVARRAGWTVSITICLGASAGN